MEELAEEENQPEDEADLRGSPDSRRSALLDEETADAPDRPDRPAGSSLDFEKVIVDSKPNQ